MCDASKITTIALVLVDTHTTLVVLYFYTNRCETEYILVIEGIVSVVLRRVVARRRQDGTLSRELKRYETPTDTQPLFPLPHLFVCALSILSVTFLHKIKISKCESTKQGIR